VSEHDNIAEAAELYQKWSGEGLRFARTLCWAFMLDQLTLIDALLKTRSTPELAAIREHLWHLVRRGPDEPAFMEGFVVGALRTTDETLDGTVDPQKAIALLNDEGLKVVPDPAPADFDNWKIDAPEGWFLTHSGMAHYFQQGWPSSLCGLAYRTTESEASQITKCGHCRNNRNKLR
jgi:hypothetical protein